MLTLRLATQMLKAKGDLPANDERIRIQICSFYFARIFLCYSQRWKAMIYNGEEFYTSKRYDIDPIIDRVGGGDSFSGGIIHGLMTNLIRVLLLNSLLLHLH